MWVRFSDVEDLNVVGCGVRARGGNIKPSLDIVGCNVEVGYYKWLKWTYRIERRDRKRTWGRGSKSMVSEGCRGEEG